MEEEFGIFLNNKDTPKKAKQLKISILGAPNAGKSSLINKLGYNL